MLIYVLGVGPEAASGVRPNAIAIEPIKTAWAATTGRNCVERSAARASAVRWQTSRNSILSSFVTCAL